MQWAKKCDTVYMKKTGFLLISILFLIFLQFLLTSSNRILTFHSKIEREIIYQVRRISWILDGNPDLNVGSSPYAIYKVTIARNENYFVVLVRDKQSEGDFILLINPRDKVEVARLALSPFQFQRNNNTDFRGLLDMDNDGNIELVCVVNGKSGKRIKIVKFKGKNLQEIPVQMVENYVNIEIKDFNWDGQPDIACYTAENGILLPPQIFKMTGGGLMLENIRLFPGCIKEYKKYIQSLEKKTRTGSNPVIAYDLMVAKARIFVSMGEKESFDGIKLFFSSHSGSKDVIKKIRMYRITILESYFFFQKGESGKAFQKIYEAIDTMYGESIAKTHRESMFHTELALYELYRNHWDSANKEIRQALLLDPSNQRARQSAVWMGLE